MTDRQRLVIDNVMKCVAHFHKLTKGEQNFVSEMLTKNNRKGLTQKEFNRLHSLANPQGKDEQQILYTKG